MRPLSVPVMHITAIMAIIVLISVIITEGKLWLIRPVRRWQARARMASMTTPLTSTSDRQMRQAHQATMMLWWCHQCPPLLYAALCHTATGKQSLNGTEQAAVAQEHSDWVRPVLGPVFATFKYKKEEGAYAIVVGGTDSQSRQSSFATNAQQS